LLKMPTKLEISQ